MYAELADGGYVGQHNEDFLGLVNDKDVNVDVTAMELIAAYEQEFGIIKITGADATSDLGEMATTILPGENVTKVVLDARNQKVADAINNGPDTDIVLLFGAGHGPGHLRRSAGRRPELAANAVVARRPNRALNMYLAMPL